jgi:hypothetical protein
VRISASGAPPPTKAVVELAPEVFVILAFFELKKHAEIGRSAEDGRKNWHAAVGMVTFCARE